MDTGWASPAYPLALWVWQEPDGVWLELHHRVDACPAAWAEDLLACVAAVVRVAASGSPNELEDLVSQPRHQPSPAFPSFDDVALEPLPVGGGEPRTSLLTAGDTEGALVEGRRARGVAEVRDVRVGCAARGGAGAPPPPLLPQTATAEPQPPPPPDAPRI